MNDNLSYSQLLKVLTELVDSKQSGTLFIHSDCNHAITFALNSGRIFAIFHGARRGRKAIPLISNITGGSYKFETSELSSIAHELPPTPEILNLLRTPQAVATDRTAGSNSADNRHAVSEDMKNQLCQQLKNLLAEHLGPIAEMVFEDTTEEMGDFCSSPELANELIEKLSLDIDDPVEVAHFRAKAHTAITQILKG